MRAALTMTTLLAISGCMTVEKTSTTDWAHLADDETLEQLPDVVFNITEIDLGAGTTSQVTYQVAHRPQFTPGGRLMFNGYYGSVWVQDTEPVEVGRFGTIVGGGGGCLMILDDSAKQLDCLNVDSWERTALQEAPLGCVFVDRASRSADGGAWSYVQQCGQMTSGGSSQPATLVVTGRADPFTATGGHGPHFGDGDVAYAAPDGLRVFDGTSSRVVLPATREREFKHPVPRGNFLYFISNVVEEYQQGVHGEKPRYVHFEVVQYDSDVRQETVLLRTGRFVPERIELSPDGKRLAVSILSERTT